MTTSGHCAEYACLSPRALTFKGKALCEAHWVLLKMNILMFLAKYPIDEKQVFRQTYYRKDESTGKIINLMRGQRIIVSRREVLAADERYRGKKERGEEEEREKESTSATIIAPSTV